MKVAAKDIGASGTAIKAATKDIGAGNTTIKSTAKDVDLGTDSVTKFGNSATDAGKKFGSFKSVLKGAASGLSGIAKTAGKIGVSTVTAAAKGIGTSTAALAGLGTAAIGVGKEFEAAMSQVDATMLLDRGSEEGQKAFETLKNAARECGRSTAFSATEAAEALNYLALAGYDANKAATALPTVLNLAGAGAMDLASASDMVTDSMSALKIDATEKNLKRFSDQLAQTASKSNTSVSQLGEAIIKVGGTASGLAGGTTELNTALGILADNGIKAAEGGTHLRNMIMSLQNARNKDAAAMFKNLGLEAYDKATGNMRSLGDIFGDLNKSLDGASAQKIDKTLSTIFKQTDLTSARAMLAATVDSVKNLGSVFDASLAESGTSMAKLGIDIKGMAKSFDTTMSQQQFTKQMRKEFSLTKEQAGVLFNGLQSLASGTGNRFNELSAAVKDSKGACKDMYDKQMDNLNGDIDILKSSLSDLGISFYEDVGGPIRDVTQAASGMVTQLNNAYMSGGLSSMLAETGSCMAQIVNGVASYAPAAVDTGIELVQSLVSGISQNSSGIASAAGNVLTAFAGGLFSLVPQISLTGVDIALQLAQSLTSQAPMLLASGTQAMSSFVDGFIQRGPEIANTALNLVQTLANGVIQNAPQLATSGIQLIGGLFTGMAGMLPQLSQIGVGLMGSLAQGIGASLPGLIPKAMQALVGFSGTLRENAGILVDAGLNLATTLAQSLISGIPVFIQTVPTIVTNIAGIVNDNAPKLLSTGIQLATQLAVGLIQSVPVIVSNIPQIVQSVASVFTAFNWMALGSQAVTSIGNGIRTAITSIPQIFSNFVQTSHSIVSSFGWQSLGRGIIQTMSNGISSMITSIPKIFTSIENFAVQGIKSIDWWNVGTTVIRLIGEGISGAGGFILDGIKGIGSGIVNGIKGIFSDGGEDKEAAESGKNAASSYADGIKTGAAEISGVASSLTSTAFTNMDLSSAALAGTQAGDAFGIGLSGSLTSGIDTTAVTTAMETAGTEGAVAFNNSMALGINMPDITKEVTTAPLATNVDTSALTQSMASAGMESGTAFSTSFSESLSATGIDTFATNMGTAGMEGMAALTESFTAGSADVTAAADTLGTQVNTSLDTTWQTAGTATQTAMKGMNQTVSTGANQMVSTIRSMSQSVVSTVRQMGSSIQSSLNSINLSSAGTNMMQGLVNGIASMQSQVEAAAKNVAQSAAKSVNSALQIHSPSRLMIKSGQYVDEGLAVGMRNNAGSVKAAAQIAMARPVINTSKRMQFDMMHPVADAKEEMQVSRVRQALNNVMAASTVHNNMVNNKSESSPTFVFSPTYQIQGNADKDDLSNVTKSSYEDFKKFIKRFMREEGIKSFA